MTAPKDIAAQAREAALSLRLVSETRRVQEACDLLDKCADAIDAMSAITLSQPSEQCDSPYAYAVYFPHQQREELVHDLDDLLEDMTNDTHTVTKLFTGPPERVALTDEQIDSIWQMTDTGDVSMDGRSLARNIERHHGIGTSATKDQS